jgi:ketosteroid isomerase-like protein
MPGWVLCKDRIELVRRLIDAFNDRNVTAALDCLHIDVEARPLDPPGVMRGHSGVRDGFDALNDRFESVSVHAGAFVASGDHVMVPVQRRAHPRDGGADLASRIFQVYTITDGKVSRFSEHPDESAALVELGLED